MRRPSGYRVFVTRNSEYHVRGHVCFGVRDRRSGLWVQDHWACGQRLATVFRDARGKLQTYDLPSVGESLHFRIDGHAHYTSEVLSVEEREGLSLQGLGGTSMESLLVRRNRKLVRETY
ncbi:MAG: hypothetical protein PVI30_07580 [Myxococcales bacterium]|jgi:hypothetical protein